MKSRVSKILLTVIIVSLLVSCNLDVAKNLRDNLNGFGGLDLKQNEPVLLGAEENEFVLSTDLSGDYEFKWYSCTKDKEDKKLVSEETAPTLTWCADEDDTESLHETGFKYYFCEVTNVWGLTKSTNVFTVAKTGLAVMHINTDGNAAIVSKDEGPGGKLSLYPGLSGKTVTAYTDLTFEEMTLRGNTTLMYEKNPYNFKLDKKNVLLTYGGITKEKKLKSKKWILFANQIDKSLSRNYVSSELATFFASKDSKGDWTPQMEFVDLYVNDNYRGQYVLSEKIRMEDADASRLAMDSIEDAASKSDFESCGFILEIDSRADAEYYFTSSLTGLTYTLCDPDFEDDDIDEDFVEDVISFMKEKVTAYETEIINNSKSDNLNNDYSEIDVPSFVNWMLVNELMKNSDAGHLSTYLWYNPSDTKIHYGPIWDFDITSGNSAKRASTDGVVIMNNTIYSKLLQNNKFKQAVVDKWDSCTSSDSSKDSILKYINNMDTSIYDKIKLSAELNFDKYESLANTYEYDIDCILSRDTYKEEFDYFKNWMLKRYDWMDKQIDALRD